MTVKPCVWGNRAVLTQQEKIAVFVVRLPTGHAALAGLFTSESHCPLEFILFSLGIALPWYPLQGIVYESQIPSHI